MKNWRTSEIKKQKNHRRHKQKAEYSRDVKWLQVKNQTNQNELYVHPVFQSFDRIHGILK